MAGVCLRIWDEQLISGGFHCEWVLSPHVAYAHRNRGVCPQNRRKEIIVASVCDVCGKGPEFGKSVSHSHRRTNRRWNPNIQRVRALVNNTPKRLNVCTSCLKAGKVTRNI